ncbi:MAG: hypothetical protein MZW92_76000 [Comamonadaceae bacterium]|nr:hypothetical protein [Comamonadaceae bacterium]
MLHEAARREPQRARPGRHARPPGADREAGGASHEAARRLSLAGARRASPPGRPRQARRCA